MINIFIYHYNIYIIMILYIYICKIKIYNPLYKNNVYICSEAHRPQNKTHTAPVTSPRYLAQLQLVLPSVDHHQVPWHIKELEGGVVEHLVGPKFKQQMWERIPDHVLARFSRNGVSSKNILLHWLLLRSQEGSRLVCATAIYMLGLRHVSHLNLWS